MRVAANEVDTWQRVQAVANAQMHLVVLPPDWLQFSSLLRDGDAPPQCYLRGEEVIPHAISALMLVIEEFSTSSMQLEAPCEVLTIPHNTIIWGLMFSGPTKMERVYQ